MIRTEYHHSSKKKGGVIKKLSISDTQVGALNKMAQLNSIDYFRVGKNVISFQQQNTRPGLNFQNT